MADSLLQPHRPFARVDEGSLGRDPEHGGRVRQNGQALTQKRQAASRGAHFHSEESQTLKETILGEPGRVDRRAVHAPGRHPGREHQADHRVPP